MVSLDHVLPGLITERRSTFGRVNDVREQHGGQYAIEHDVLPADILEQDSNFTKDGVASTVPMPPANVCRIVHLPDLREPGIRDPHPRARD